MTHSKTLIVVTGPTGVGKTAAAIGAAQQLGCEIINADSRQCPTILCKLKTSTSTTAPHNMKPM